MMLTAFVCLPKKDKDDEYEVINLVTCGECFYWKSGCCTKYGKQGHPARWSDDFCSRGARRDEND
jgi:hypothetical protein